MNPPSFLPILAAVTTHFLRGFIILATMLLTGTVPAMADDNIILRYEGQIKVAGKPFSGPGYFFFSLKNSQGELFWTSGDFPFRGTTNLPAGVVRQSVLDGSYEVHLGDTSLGFPPLKSAGILAAKTPVLEIWFNDGLHGWQPAGQEVGLEDVTARIAADSRDEAILGELRSIHNLLEQQNVRPAPAPAEPPPPTTATVKLTGPSIGKADAPLVLVEFTDFQCPFCKSFHEQTFPGLVQKYVETGKLRIVTRFLPLAFHNHAEAAAQAGFCADEQGKFWPMRDGLFARSAELSQSNILNAAIDAKLDINHFTGCLQSNVFAGRVLADKKEAEGASLNGTPSFVLGKPQGTSVTGIIIVGAQPISAFEAEIDKLLSAK